MFALSGYDATDLLTETGDAAIYRGIEQATGARVILKVVINRDLTPERLEALHDEYRLISSLKGLLRPYKWCHSKEGAVIILEDPGGIPLESIVAEGPCEIGEFLAIALKLVDAIADIHRQEYLLLGLDPATILFDRESGSIAIIDFGHALSKTRAEEEWPREVDSIERPSLVAPEQTGKTTGAQLDRRTDYYALGLVFYALLTAKPPFKAQTALEWVHGHIALKPRPIADLRPDIPPTLAAIVHKLLSKDPAERYQTSDGLRADIAACQNGWLKSGRVPVFVLGTEDDSPGLRLPTRLYGRGIAAAKLAKRYIDVAASGTPALALIQGPAGIGKTALVEEVVADSVLEKGGRFSVGKGDQHHIDTPYFALATAIGDFVRQLLCEPSHALDQWRSRVKAAMGHDGQLIVDVVPALTALVGDQPQLSDLTPDEAQRRLERVFGRLIAALGTRGKPLVLFFDNAQWLDDATVALLISLIRERPTRHLFLICAYRDNQISDDHPLLRSANSAEQNGSAVTRITLRGISIAAIESLLIDTLNCSRAGARQMAPVVTAKTGGNPFHLRQFLSYLNHAGVLRLDVARNRWDWDLGAISRIPATGGIADLVVAEFQRLPIQTQATLQAAACYGTRFTAELLAKLLDRTESTIVDDLDSADLDNLLTREGEVWSFAHDQVREVIYERVPQADAAALHLRIGRLLLGKGQAGDAEFFDILRHLNAGISLVETASERTELAQLNLRAAKKAREFCAFSSALTYLEHGADLLGPDRWSRHYDLALSIAHEAVECAYQADDSHRLNAMVSDIIDHGRTLFDRIPAYDVLSRSLRSRHALDESLALTKRVCSMLEMPLPDPVTPEAVNAEIARAKSLTQDLGLAAIEHLPTLSNARLIAAVRVMDSGAMTAYFGDPPLGWVIESRICCITLEHGLTRRSLESLASLGYILCDRGEIDFGYRIGQFCRDLSRRRGIAEEEVKTTSTFLACINYWKQPLRGNVEALLESYRTAFELGDYEYAAYYLAYAHSQALFSGVSLPFIRRQLTAHIRDISPYQQSQVMPTLYCCLDFIDRLCGTEEGAEPQPSDAFRLDPAVHSGNKTAVFRIHAFRGIVDFLLGDNAEASNSLEAAEEYLCGVAGQHVQTVYVFYRAMALASGESKDGEASSASAAALERAIERFGSWAPHCPENFMPKLAILRARLADLQDSTTADFLYNEAIKIADGFQALQDCALACELAARRQLVQRDSNLDLASYYLQRARARYAQWGAKAKVAELQKEFGQLVMPRTRQTGAQQSIIGNLDALAIAKLSQAMSEEIVFDSLIEKLMTVLLEQAGASFSALLLMRKEGLRLVATSRTEQTITVELHDRRVDATTGIPLTTLNYVQRTLKPVVIDGQWSQDDGQISGGSAKSIMCIPIIHQTKLVGLLYFENALVAHAFTPERVSTLQLLARQAAISLENARMFGALEQREVQERQAARLVGLAHWQLTLGSAQSGAASLYLSTQVPMLLGYPAEELCLDRPEEFARRFIDENDRNRFLDADLGLRNGLVGEVDLSLRFRAPGGREVWLRWMVERQTTSDGQIQLFGVMQDITAVKRRESQLQRAKKQLDRAQRIARVGVVSYHLPSHANEGTGLDDAEIEYSTAAEEITGLTVELREGRSDHELWRDYIHPDDRERVLAAYRAIRECKSGQFEQEFRQLRPDGRTIILNEQIEVSTDELGGTHFDYVFQDVTQARARDKELREKGIRAQQAANLANLSYWQAVRDESSNVFVMRSYPLAAAVLGVGAEQFDPARPEVFAEAFVASENRAEFIDQNAALRDGKVATIDIEFRFLRRDREDWWLRWLAERRLTQDGRTELFGAVQNISDRKHRELELYRANRRLERAQQIARIGYVSHRLPRGAYELHRPWGAPLECTDMFEKILGIDEAMLTGMSDYDYCEIYVHPDDREQLKKHYAQVNAKPQGRFQCEYRLIRPDGRLIYLREFEDIVTDPATNESYYDFAFQDVTDLRLREQEVREREEQLLHSQKFEALGALASGIAHDFHNVLAGINGYAELARLKDYDREQTKLFFAKIKEGVTLGKEMVSRVMAFARKSDFAPKDVDIYQVVTDASTLLRHTLPPAVDLELDIRGSDLAVSGDPIQIQQALVNLCNNASQAMPEGGTIKMTAEEVHLSSPLRSLGFELQPGTYVALSVTDSGSGIPDEIRSRIFDPFFTTKSAGKGTGLGLSIVQQTVKAHRGAISFETAMGRGTTFRILLPRSLSATSSAPARRRKEKIALPKGKRQSVLFVDDDPRLTDSGSQLLALLNYKVTTTNDPVEALQMVKNDPTRFDVVVTDLKMPQMSGQQLIVEIRRIRPELPVIVATGYDDLEGKAMRSSNSVLHKPYELEEIAKALSTTLKTIPKRNRRAAP